MIFSVENIWIRRLIILDAKISFVPFHFFFPCEFYTAIFNALFIIKFAKFRCIKRNSHRHHYFRNAIYCPSFNVIPI